MSDSVTTIQNALTPVLKPFSWAYGTGMRIRETMYKRGLFASWEPPTTTVSVGNIGWGGSGKTPIAGWLLDWADGRNINTMLLTRGYKAKPVKYPYHVRPGALAEEAGDEPLMLATDHPKAHIIVDPIRSRAGRWGMKKFRPKMIVLDDGFQHMAVKRNVNIVLLRPEDLGEQWNRVIPAGSWREPLAALKRADLFMIKVGPRNFARVLPRFNELLGHLKKPIFSFQVAPTGVRHVLKDMPEQEFDASNYILVTGVGNPKLVNQTATQFFGQKPMKHMVYKDHHAYTKNDVFEMVNTAKKLGSTAILCTPKDAVKLGPLCTEIFWQFDLRVVFGKSSIGPKVKFDTWWNRHYDRLAGLQPGQNPIHPATGEQDGQE